MEKDEEDVGDSEEGEERDAVERKVRMWWSVIILSSSVHQSINSVPSCLI